MKKWFLFILCLPFYSILAQKTLTFTPIQDENTPHWAILMYQENPNVWEVDEAYRQYYTSRDFVKNTHTQFYKKWRRKIEPFINQEGYVKMPSLDQIQKKERNWLQQWSAHNLAKDGENEPVWKSVGPFQTHSTDAAQTVVSWQANVYSIDQSLSNPDILYCGTESGGIFKTEDKGLNWEHASFYSLLRTVTAVKIHPNNPNIVFAGDGANVYKTIDGGTNWEKVFTRSGLGVNAFVINPVQPEIILVAGFGGLFRSADGGNTWDQLYTNKCWDLAIHPSNPSIVYLLKNNPGKKKCEFLKSTNQGLSFSVRDGGWYDSTHPDRQDDGARMTVTPADSDVIYVVLVGTSKPGDNGFIGVFKSSDAGENWSLPNLPVGGPYTDAHPNLMTLSNTNNLYQGYYNLGIAASHTNPDQVLIGGLNLWKTEDGADSFTILGGYRGNVPWIHPDQQEILVLGDDMWVASDGGVNYSTNLFQSHQSRINGLSATDFWGFGSGWNEDLLVGGRYHNGNTAFRNTFPEGQFLRLGGGEAPTGYVNPGIAGRAYFSDISTQSIPNTISGEVLSFPPLSKYPGESFFAAHSSELEFDPLSYKTIYVGEAANLWRSENEGSSFELVKSFGSDSQPVLHIEISRKNPEVIYVYQRTAFFLAKLWKTTDGGDTWTAFDFPAASSQRAGTMTLSATDENVLWVAFGHQNNDGSKVFKTTDGGLSWENLSTPVLNGHMVNYILHQAGTDGAVYLATNNSVFYRDNTMTNWELFNDGLPQRINGNILRPFYKADKLRMATYGNGIWEVDFKKPSVPIAQPIVDKRIGFCSRDTFYFEDYSILNHTNASWEWSFPGASYVSATNVRNPKVVFGQAGLFDVSLKVANEAGSDTRTISGMVEIKTDNCSVETRPGLALKLNGGVMDLATTSPLNLYSNTITFSAWIKRDGRQNPNSAILFCRGGTTVAGINFGDNNELRYHWNDTEWWWNSGLIVPDQEWTHIALVIMPNRAIIYMNGVPAINNANHPEEAFDANFIIGGDPNHNNRRMNGQIEEVCIWNRALSQDEIRDLRHLIKKPDEDISLVLYYQFNEELGQIMDRVGTKHASIGGGGTRITSTCPVGRGISHRMLVDNAGEKVFGDTGLSLDFAEGNNYPNGELVVSRLNQLPDQNANDSRHSTAYWIINNYGQNAHFRELNNIRFQEIGEVTEMEAAAPEKLNLFTRPENAEGETWQKLDIADEATAGDNGSVGFTTGNSITEFGQFVIARSGMSTSSTIIEKRPNPFLVYPNPVATGNPLYIDTEEKQTYTFSLFNMEGKRVFRQEMRGKVSIPVTEVPTGIYFYQIALDTKIFHGKINID